MIPSTLCHVLSQLVPMNFIPGPLAKEPVVAPVYWALGARVLRMALQKDPTQSVPANHWT